MIAGMDLSLRGPDAYGLARTALQSMEANKVWPTPLNYELWLHYVGNPQSPLGLEIERLIGSGQTITEAVSEALAAQYLPKARLNEEIRDAGDKLNQQLESITQAMQVAQRSNAAYGKTLAGAATELAEHDVPQADLNRMVTNLTLATRKVQKENSALEERLSASTAEVERLREHLEEVRREAMTDALTTLANRKAFDEGLAQACETARVSGKPLSLAIMDIDHFKRFNDTWGHQTGDQVLRYVASVMARVGENPRLAARFGGEEFAVIFPGEPTSALMSELDEIRTEIGSRALKRRSTNEELGSVKISVGVADFCPGDTPTSLLERADAALYASKRGGRDRITRADIVAVASEAA